MTWEKQAILAAVFIAALMAVITSEVSDTSNAESDSDASYTITGKTFNVGLDSGFVLANSQNTPIGGCLTSVEVSGENIKTFSHNGKTAYAAENGIKVSMSRQYTDSNINGTVFSLSNDSWGQYNETVLDGKYRGQIHTGLGILQVFKNGSWIDVVDASFNCDSGWYFEFPGDMINEGGLFRIAYCYELVQPYHNVVTGHYWTAADYATVAAAALTTPWGIGGAIARAIIGDGSGKIYTAVKDHTDNTFDIWTNLVDVFEFYVCSSHIDVQVSNMTPDGDWTYQYDSEKVSIDPSDTMSDGSLSTTGIMLQRYNKFLDVDVKYNGKNIPIPWTNAEDNACASFTDEGLYTITSGTAYGSITKKYYVIHQDSLDSVYNIKLDGERTYVEGQEIPSYVSLSLSFDSHPGNLPVMNCTVSYDGKEFAVDDDVTFDKQGIVIIKFSLGLEASGDRCIKTYMAFINEVPVGPVLNQKVLMEKATPIPLEAYAYPRSAGEGSVSILFKNKDQAIDYVFQYERSRVKQDSDGHYVIAPGSSSPQYISGIDLDEALRNYAESVIKYVVLDPSKTILLTGELGDLSTISLKEHVIVYGEEFGDIDQNVPILGATRYTLDIDTNEIKTRLTDIKFQNYLEGIDCCVVTASQGSKSFIVEFGTSFLDQCIEQGFEGYIDICETNLYGRQASYRVFVSTVDHPILRLTDGSSILEGELIEGHNMSIDSVTSSLDGSITIIPDYDESAVYTSTFDDAQYSFGPGSYVVYLSDLSGGKTIKIKVTSTDHTEETVVVEHREATCTEIGSEHIVTRCTLCGLNLSDVWATTDGPMGHTESVEITNEVEGNCVTDHTYDLLHVCTRCDETLSVEHVIVKAPGHSAVTDAAVQSTCVSTGLTEGSHCDRCNKVISAQHVTPMIDHVPMDSVEVDYIASTCTTQGSYESVISCEFCHLELSRIQFELPLAEHTPGEPGIENLIDSTNDTSGTYDEVKRCLDCGEILSTTSIYVAPKNYAESNTTPEPCSEESDLKKIAIEISVILGIISVAGLSIRRMIH